MLVRGSFFISFAISFLVFTNVRADSYRDPNGLIWSAAQETQRMNQLEAQAYCRGLGERLPTEGEFRSLAVSFGMNSAEGYSPYLRDGLTPIIPGFSSAGYYWSSTRTRSDSDSDAAFEFSAADGYMAVTSVSQFNPVLCVNR